MTQMNPLRRRMIEDMTIRMVAIIKDIHNVIDDNTGEVTESAYKLAEMNIDKSERFVENDISCYSTMFYAEHLLQRFSMMLTAKEQSRLRKKMEHLKKMNTEGTYEENLSAFEALDKALEDSPASLFMFIDKAAELCEEHEPAKAPKFQHALSKLMTGMTDSKPDEAALTTTLEEIMQEAREIIEKYDIQTAKIQKGITR